MYVILSAVALATAQAAPAAPVDHKQHDAAAHARHGQERPAEHQGEHKCCEHVDGKMECRMMKGHGGQHGGGQADQGHQGHSGH